MSDLRCSDDRVLTRYRKSHTWPEALTYPPGPAMTESCTATMIPVSTLAREGLLPVTMGMVLCNDENIAPFVNMVQGLHAEGVVSTLNPSVYHTLTTPRHSTSPSQTRTCQSSSCRPSSTRPTHSNVSV